MIRRAFYIFICLSLFLFSAYISAEGLSNENTGGSVKCGTPNVVNLIHSTGISVAKIAQRSELDTYAISSLKHFRVHYDTTGYNAVNMLDEDGNNIPDYIDSTMVYLEYAYDLQINQLGFPAPISDGIKGGGNEVDIYMKNLNNTYGQTYPESLTGSSATAYMEIENDYAESVFQTKGYDALKVTTAHEFFHIVQFSLFYNWDILWWMEQSAVWMEDRAWDDVNDYIHYLHLFFNKDHNQTPLDLNTGNFMYGAGVWAKYLAKKFGDNIIYDIWTTLESEKSTDIETFDNVLPNGLSTALGEFAVWNYFTKDRANTIDFYADSDIFTVDITTDLSAQKSPASDTLTTKNLTSRYVELLFAGEWEENDSLNVKVNPLDGGIFQNNLILYNGPYDYEICSIESAGSDIIIHKDWSKAILVSSCVNTVENTYKYDFSSRILDIGEEPQYVFSISQTYPNPFNSQTTIPITLPQSGNVSIQAYNILGQKADDIFNGNLDAGEKFIIWKPSGLSGGIYIIKMKSPWGSKNLKTMFLK